MRFKVGDKAVVKNGYLNGSITEGVRDWIFTSYMKTFPVVTISKVMENSYQVEENGCRYPEEFFQPKVKVGDTVKVIGGDELVSGYIGKVAFIERGYQYLVALKDFDGHTGGGKLTKSNGWWLSETQLLIVDDAVEVTPVEVTPKYQVGDVVSIVPLLLDGYEHTDVDFTFVHDMSKSPKVTIKEAKVIDYEGRTVVRYKVNENDFNYSDGMFSAKVGYTVGDKIQIKSYLLDGNRHSDVRFGFNPLMSKNPVVTLKTISGGMFTVEENSYIYSTDMFDKIVGVKEVKELTLAEICDRLGYEVKVVK